MEKELTQWMALAEETWEDARYLVEDRQRYRSAVSRGYYSMFHAAQALMLFKGLKAKSHSGLLHLLNQHFVRTKEIAPDYYRLLGIAFQARQIGDYDPQVEISASEAEVALAQARQFIDVVRQYLSSQGFFQG